MVFLGFAFGTWLASWRAKSEGISSNTVMDLVVWILISSLLGARFTYVIFHLDEFAGRWRDIISPIQSDGTIGIAGLVVLGGVVVAVPVAAWFLKRRQISFLKMMDILIPSLAFGIGLGRIGCFLNGCCYGHPTDLPWGMVFPETCIAGSAYPGQAIHPTQLYAVLYNFGIGIYLILRTSKRKFTGELFYSFLLLYGLFRFMNETLRYYRQGMVPMHIGSYGVTVSMIISVAMAAAGLILLIKGFQNSGSRRK